MRGGMTPDQREATARAQALCDRLGPGWSPGVTSAPIECGAEPCGYYAESGYLRVYELWRTSGLSPDRHLVYRATAGKPDQTSLYYISQPMSTPEAAVADVLLRMSTDVRHRSHVHSEAWAAPGVNTIRWLLHVGARVDVWFQDAWRGGVVLRRETIVSYDLAIVEFDEPVGLDRQTIADPELFGVEQTGGWRLAGWAI